MPIPRELLTFGIFVPGTPQPAGSKKAIPVFNRATRKFATAANGRPIVSVVDDAKHSRAWKSHVSAMAADGMGDSAPFDRPLELRVAFVMPRPKSHFGSRKGAPYLKPTAPEWHTAKPDATKLLRAVEDALTGIVWRDDSCVAAQHVTKRYGEKPGARIEIRPLQKQESPR